MSTETNLYAKIDCSTEVPADLQELRLAGAYGRTQLAPLRLNECLTGYEGYTVEVWGPVVTKTGKLHATSRTTARYGSSRYVTPLGDLPEELRALLMGPDEMLAQTVAAIRAAVSL